jgi:hypothetical protein
MTNKNFLLKVDEGEVIKDNDGGIEVNKIKSL